MPSPFPGMDPYLEDPWLWSDFAGYARELEYAQPPNPPLDESDAAWARELLAGQASEREETI